MVDNEPRVGVAVDQRRARVDVAPEQDVDFCGGLGQAAAASEMTIRP
jgi:hypothetical protein